MRFKRYPEYEGQHAFLGASSYHWLNYSEEKLANTYSNLLAKQKGTELHEFAATCIRLGQKLPESQKTLNLFVNDAIGYRMSPEVVLFYSDNCFGTTDAIAFNNNILRIHDYKSGVTPAKMEQLMIYAALFCLDYKVKPSEIDDIELRIYQFDDYTVCHPTAEEVTAIINTIIKSDKIIDEVRTKEG